MSTRWLTNWRTRFGRSTREKSCPEHPQTNRAARPMQSPTATNSRRKSASARARADTALLRAKALVAAEGHDGDQRYEQHQPEGVNVRFYPRVGFAARDGFIGEEREAPAVECGEREQIEAAEVRAERGEEPQKIRCAALGGLRRFFHDA